MSSHNMFSRRNKKNMRTFWMKKKKKKNDLIWSKSKSIGFFLFFVFFCYYHAFSKEKLMEILFLNP